MQLTPFSLSGEVTTFLERVSSLIRDFSSSSIRPTYCSPPATHVHNIQLHSNSYMRRNDTLLSIRSKLCALLFKVIKML